MFVKHGGYHSDGDDSTAGLDDVLNGLVGHSHHVLSIHLHKVNDIVVWCYFTSLSLVVFYLNQVMVDEESISGGGRPDNDGLDFRLLELKADVTGRVLVQGQRSLEWPVDQRNIITLCFWYVENRRVFGVRSIARLERPKLIQSHSLEINNFS